MRLFTRLYTAALLGAAGLVHAQSPALPNAELPRNGEPLSGARILRLAPALDRIVSTREKVYVVRGSNEFGITDGNIWVPNGASGYFLFSDIAANVIYKYAPATQALSVYLNNSGYTGTPTKISQEGYISRSGPLYTFDFGSNGIAIDPQGRLVLAAQGDKTIVRLEKKDGSRTVLASRYEGKPLDRPNKLAILADGTIFFSDINFPTCPNCEQTPLQALYRIKNGEVTRVEPLGHGVTLSPDQKILYTSANHPVIPGQPIVPGGLIMRYDIGEGDSLLNGRVFVDMAGQTAPNGVPGGPDGFTVDREGNIYSGGPGGVWILDPHGRHIGTILLPETATNLGFGDDDMKTLYLLDRRNVLKIRLRAAGVAPPAGAAYEVPQSH